MKNLCNGRYGLLVYRKIEGYKFINVYRSCIKKNIKISRVFFPAKLRKFDFGAIL